MSEKGLTAFAYHKETNHARSRLDGAPLDWANQPDVFKCYPDAGRIPLPSLRGLCGQSLWDIVSNKKIETELCQISLEFLAGIFAMGNGITLKRVHGGMVYTFRSAASAGALYPVEIYADIRSAKGVEPGLYHVNIRDYSLERLRSYPGFALGNAGPSVRVFLTGIFYRSAWKYRKRAYRYILNDVGHVAGNMLLEAMARGIDANLQFDFPDDRINGFLGLDPEREVCLACLGLGPGLSRDDLFRPGCFEGMDDPLEFQASPVSAKEISYPRNVEIHRSGRMASPLKNEDKNLDFKALSGRVSRWETIPAALPGNGVKGFSDSIFNRRSRRNFIGKPLTDGQLTALLGIVAQTWRLIRDRSGFHPGFLPGFVCGGTGSVPPGFYIIDPGQNRFGLLEEGVLIPSMAGACLDQLWLKMAGVHFVLISNVASVDETLGPRGYRRVMINAGLMGQVIYLAAVSLGLGCCGIGAYYDDETAQILDLDDQDRLMYLLAVGRVKTEPAE